MSEVLSYLTVFKTVILTTQPGFYLVKVVNRNTIDTTARCEMCLKLKLSSHLPKEFFCLFHWQTFKNESAKLRALHGKNVLQRALRAYMLTCQRVLLTC